MKIHFSILLFGIGQLLQQGGQLEETIGIEPTQWQPEQVARRGVGPVCPFAGNAKTATIQLPE